MSVIGHREWNIWTNLDFFDEENEVAGVVYLKITPSLMSEQTIGFIYEKLEQIRTGQPQFTNPQLRDYFDLSWISPTKESVIQKRGRIVTNSEAVRTLISDVLQELEALSICLDFPFTCNEIRFHILPSQPNHGDVFVASRKPIGRGIGFEVEERGSASARLTDDFDKVINATQSQRVAIRHYLNGLTLLGLEDQFSGLIDAAFMQFYQACEVLCGENFKLIEVKKYIAREHQDDSRTLQLIAHHVWQIRHNYFGHGNVSNNIANLDNLGNTFNAAKQVLVVRWLCKRLLDLTMNANPLVREMRLYHQNGSVAFNGSVEQMIESFYIGYDYTNANVVDTEGHTLETVALNE